MKNAQTYILEPDEYVTASSMRPFGGHFLPAHGLMITKDGANTWVSTGGLSVDEGCRIQLAWSGKGFGRVKHLTSTPRRKYYMALRNFTLILWALAWIFLLIEMLVFNNRAIGDSRTNLVMLTAFTAWMGLVIVVERNQRGFTKWFSTIFSYFVLPISTGAFIWYLVRLIQETVL